jgi:hypothetical protein
MEKRRLRESILDQIEAKDLTVKDVIDKAGIPEQYFDAIISDRRDKLPAFPYIRVHLVKVAQLLGLDADEAIRQYKDEFINLRSGSADTLPGNRFALPSSRRKYIIGAGVIGLIILGFMFKSSGFFGQPKLTLVMPPIDSRDPFITESSTIVLAGRIDPSDKLFINNQATPVAVDGSFAQDYDLQPELNPIEFRVSRFLGRDLKVTKNIYYREPAGAAAEETVTEVGITASSSQSEE